MLKDEGMHVVGGSSEDFVVSGSKGRVMVGCEIYLRNRSRKLGLAVAKDFMS